MKDLHPSDNIVEHIRRLRRSKQGQYQDGSRFLQSAAEMALKAVIATAGDR